MCWSLIHSEKLQIASELKLINILTCNNFLLWFLEPGFRLFLECWNWVFLGLLSIANLPYSGFIIAVRFTSNLYFNFNFFLRLFIARLSFDINRISIYFGSGNFYLGICLRWESVNFTCTLTFTSFFANHEDEYFQEVIYFNCCEDLLLLALQLVEFEVLKERRTTYHFKYWLNIHEVSTNTESPTRFQIQYFWKRLSLIISDVLVS